MQRERPVTEKNLPLEREKQEDKKKTEGQCKDRHGVGGLKEEHLYGRNKWQRAVHCRLTSWGAWQQKKYMMPSDHFHYGKWRVGENGWGGDRRRGEQEREKRRDKRHGIVCSSSSTIAHTSTLGTCCVTADTSTLGTCCVTADTSTLSPCCVNAHTSTLGTRCVTAHTSTLGTRCVTAHISTLSTCCVTAHTSTLGTCCVTAHTSTLGTRWQVDCSLPLHYGTSLCDCSHLYTRHTLV